MKKLLNGVVVSFVLIGTIIGGIYLSNHQKVASLPMTATYQGVVDSGEPLSKGWYKGVDSMVVADFASYDYFIQPPTPLSDPDTAHMGRMDLLEAVRKANPNIKLIAQVTAGHWPMSAPDTLTYYGDFRMQLDRAKAFVSYAPGTVDMANPLAVKTCVRVWTKWCLRKPWHGMFIDVFQGVPPDEGKFAEAGFSSREEYREAWRSGWLTLARELRANAPKGSWLAGNFGPPDSVMGTIFDSWLMENWPYQSGGFAMMERARRWYKGPMVIFTAGYPGGFTGPNAEINVAKANFGRACAAIFGAIYIFQPPDAVSTHDQTWWKWKQEKWVLGRPLSPAYRTIEDGIWRRDFERGSVWANPAGAVRGGVVFKTP